MDACDLIEEVEPIGWARLAIEGAAERYGEQVQIVEQMCMKRGDPICRFELRFTASATGRLETPEQTKHQQAKQQFAQFILALLPDEGGFTLTEVQKAVVLRGMKREWARPALLLEALRHLHHAGLVATSANHTGDDFVNRRYWRAPMAGRPASGPLSMEREAYVRR